MAMQIRTSASDAALQIGAADAITYDSTSITLQHPTSIVGNLTVNGSLVPNGSNIVDLSSATTDYALAVGQTAIYDVSSAVTYPLYLATGDNQLYDIYMSKNQPVVPTGATSLSPNNTAYGAVFVIRSMYESNTSAIGYAALVSNFLIGGNTGVITLQGSINTKTTCKSGQFMSTGSSTTVNYTVCGGITWNDSTTPWTSLGTINFTSAWSGRIIIRRVA